MVAPQLAGLEQCRAKLPDLVRTGGRREFGTRILSHAYPSFPCKEALTSQQHHLTKYFVQGRGGRFTKSAVHGRDLNHGAARRHQPVESLADS